MPCPARQPFNQIVLGPVIVKDCCWRFNSGPLAGFAVDGLAHLTCGQLTTRTLGQDLGRWPPSTSGLEGQAAPSWLGQASSATVTTVLIHIFFFQIQTTKCKIVLFLTYIVQYIYPMMVNKNIVGTCICNTVARNVPVFLFFVYWPTFLIKWLHSQLPTLKVLAYFLILNLQSDVQSNSLPSLIYNFLSTKLCGKSDVQSLLQ